MNKLPPRDESRVEEDPRRRLGLPVPGEEKEEEEEDPKTVRRKIWRDRLAIAGVVLALIVLVFMMFTDAVENYQCSPWQFVTFQCNRFDAKFKPWE
jgi:hypothetical protein